MKHPLVLATVQRVLDCIKTLPVQSFTTCEVADALVAAGEFQDVEYSKLERSIRQSVVWLIERGMAQPAGARKKKTQAGNTSWPETYTITHWSPQPKPTQQMPEPSFVDFEALNRTFLRW